MLNRAVAAALGCLALTGCEALVTQAPSPLERAFSEPVASLREQAEAGDAGASYALSFLMRYGVRGVPVDIAEADALASRAARPSTLMLTQYTAGLNGAPGRVNMIPVTTPGIAAETSSRLNMCGMTVLADMQALGELFCGSPLTYKTLRPLAVAALVEGAPTGLPSREPVDPASVADCGASQALWRDAGRRTDGGDFPGATAATDRIIALCGESEPSWHARVMRALLATRAGAPAEAIALLEPVPRPAPAPIGGYVSFVAMQAAASAGDWPAYRAERDALANASLAALQAEPTTRMIAETIEAPGSTIRLFERPSAMGVGLDIVMVGLVSQTDERAAPMTFYLTRSVDLQDPSRQQYFLDEYRCDGRSTLKYFGALEAVPNAEDVRTLILQRLAGELAPASGSSFNRGLSACQFPVQVAPGLGDP